LTGLNVGLTPEAVISGRVLDDNGDPVPQVQVDAVPATGSDDFGMEFGRHERTDERGRFRMTGPYGKYYIKASPERQMEDDREIRSDGLRPPVYATTYYPSSGNQDQA